MVLVSIGTLAAGAANAAAGNAVAASEPITAAAIYWPAWILVGGVLIALLIMIGVLTSIKTTLTAKPKKRDEEFTRMLCRQVWKHTDVIKGTFYERLRMPPGDSDTLRVLIRLLREDLASPMSFIGQLRGDAPATWPNYELFAAFNNWAGKIAAIESQLADMQQMLNYPVVREPVDANRDTRLLHYFVTEQAPLSYAIGQVVTHAMAICDLGNEVLKKAHSSGWKMPVGGNEEEPEKPACDACGSKERHTSFGNGEPRIVVMAHKPEIKKDEKKKEEPKPQQSCYCTVPRPCYCVPAACVCACSCKSDGAAKHAH